MVRQRDGNTLSAIVLNVTLPALVLSTLPEVEIEPSMAVVPFLAIVQNAVVFLIALFVFRREPGPRRGLLLICSIGFNNGLFAFPIVGGIWGSEAVAILAIFDIGNAVVLLGVNYAVGAFFAEGREAVASGETLATVAKSLATSAPLIALAVALLLNWSSISLLPVLTEPIGMLAAANTGLVLLLLGVFQSFDVRAWEPRTLFRVYAVRYIPGLLCGLALFLFSDYSELVRKVLLVAFALPVGMSVIPFSVRFGFDVRLATTMVNSTILVSFAVIWVVVAVVG